MRRLVELLGGTVKLSSCLGRGSCFTFYFPKVKVINDAHESTKNNLLDEDLGQFFLTKVLIADDVASNRELIKGYFADTNCHLLSASDGREALELARQYHPELILLDVRMPYLNGHQVARSLYKDSKTRDIPIVIITATSGNSNLVDLEQICQGYLHKPVSRYQLVEVLKRIFEPGSLNISKSYTEAASTEKLATTPASKLEFSELIVKLRHELKTSWTSLCQTLKSSDIRQFITRLEIWGEEYQCQPLQDYVRSLKEQMDAFDWGKLPQTVNKFPQIVGSVEALGGE